MFHTNITLTIHKSIEHYSKTCNSKPYAPHPDHFNPQCTTGPLHRLSSTCSPTFCCLAFTSRNAICELNVQGTVSAKWRLPGDSQRNTVRSEPNEPGENVDGLGILSAPYLDIVCKARKSALGMWKFSSEHYGCNMENGAGSDGVIECEIALIRHSA
jgi:hypothetical protein